MRWPCVSLAALGLGEGGEVERTITEGMRHTSHYCLTAAPNFLRRRHAAQFLQRLLDLALLGPGPLARLDRVASPLLFSGRMLGCMLGCMLICKQRPIVVPIPNAQRRVGSIRRRGKARMRKRMHVLMRLVGSGLRLVARRPYSNVEMLRSLARTPGGSEDRVLPS